jgi:hypothetical protein
MRRRRQPPESGSVIARNAAPSRRPGSQQVEVVPRQAEPLLAIYSHNSYILDILINTVRSGALPRIPPLPFSMCMSVYCRQVALLVVPYRFAPTALSN